MIEAVSNATVTPITAGAYSNTDVRDYLAEGYTLEQQADGYWHVIKDSTYYAASLWNGTGTPVKYTDIEAAFNAANSSGGTLALLRDIERSDFLSVTGTFTLDLNGYILSAGSGVSLLVNATGNLTVLDSHDGGMIRNVLGPAITVQDNGVLNLGEGAAAYSSGNVAIDLSNNAVLNTTGDCFVSSSSYQTAAIIMNGATVNLSDGTFTGDYALWYSSGTVNISGQAELIGGSGNGLAAINWAVSNLGASDKINISGGKLSGNTILSGSVPDNCLSITGGSFKSTVAVVEPNTRYDTIKAELLAYLASGYQLTNAPDGDGYYPVEPSGETYPIMVRVKSGVMGVYTFRTIAEAWAFVNSDEAFDSDMTLYADIVTAVPLVMKDGHSVTLNFNGQSYTYTYTGAGAAFTVPAGRLVIDASNTISAADANVVDVTGGYLELYYATLTASGDEHNAVHVTDGTVYHGRQAATLSAV